MVEANSDPEVVTALIKRETRDAAAARAEEEAAQSDVASPVAPVAVPATAAEMSIVPGGSVAPDRSQNAPGFWNVQLVFAAVLVAALIVVWVIERRSSHRTDEESGYGG